MAVYGGFEPGTYQAWALNLSQNVFGSPGIARGLQVVPTNPLGLSVNVTVDPTALDGVGFLPNGCWVRIDAALLLNVPSNGTGQTRNDAVVATVDPTGNLATSLSYVTNWSGGFAGGTNNQLVLALISVPSGASSIGSGNITMSTVAASFGAANFASSASWSLSATNLGNPNYPKPTGTSVQAQTFDNSASGFFTVQIPNASAGARGFAVAPINAGGTLFPTYFNVDGSIQAVSNKVSLGPTNMSTTLPVAAPSYAGNVIADTGGSIFPKSNTTGMRIFMQGVTTGISYQKYDILILLPFN